MKRLLFWPYQLYAWLVFVPLAVALTLLFSTLTVIAASIFGPRFASRVVPSAWARLLARLTPMFVTVRGGEHADPARSYVVVLNHQSQYDILLVYGWLKLDLKWVMKQELRRIPGIGIGCERAGHIFVDRRNPRQAREAVMRALEQADDGVGILFFAEGTRSLDGRLLPFKKGAFRVAIEQQLPVLPVTVTGTRDILPAKTWRLFPGRGTMVIHPAIDTAGLTLDDLDGLLERSREAIASALPPELRAGGMPATAGVSPTGH